MSGFKSDAQRRYFFANHGSSGGGGALPSFPDFQSAFDDMNMEQKEREYAQMWSQSSGFVATGGANVDGPAAGGRNPMPSCTPEESAAWRQGHGFKK